jgi:hypothetical protein
LGKIHGKNVEKTWLNMWEKGGKNIGKTMGKRWKTRWKNDMECMNIGRLQVVDGKSTRLGKKYVFLMN